MLLSAIRTPSDHAGQNRPQTEIFVRDVSRDLSLSPRDFFQVVVYFPHDPRTWNLRRKSSFRQQTPHFAAQKKHATPKSHCHQAKDA